NLCAFAWALRALREDCSFEVYLYTLKSLSRIFIFRPTGRMEPSLKKIELSTPGTITWRPRNNPSIATRATLSGYIINSLERRPCALIRARPSALVNTGPGHTTLTRKLENFNSWAMASENAYMKFLVPV